MPGARSLLPARGRCRMKLNKLKRPTPDPRQRRVSTAGTYLLRASGPVSPSPSLSLARSLLRHTISHRDQGPCTHRERICNRLRPQPLLTSLEPARLARFFAACIAQRASQATIAVSPVSLASAVEPMHSAGISHIHASGSSAHKATRSNLVGGCPGLLHGHCSAVIAHALRRDLPPWY
jgi:hypothetical protein